MAGWLVMLFLWASSAGTAEGLRAALAAEERGDDAAAIAALDRLIAQSPHWELPRLEAARIRLKSGTGLEDAEAHLDIARALAPENPRGHFLWALLQIERHRPERAIRALEVALTYRTDYPDARFRLGSLFEDAERWVEAERQFRYLAWLKPEWAQPRLRLALALERQGRLDEAEKTLKDLLVETQQPALVRELLAQFYERRGRPEEAERLRAQAPPAPKRSLRPLPKSRR